MLRKIITVIFVSFSCIAFSQAIKNTSIKFDSLVHDFGEVKLNGKREYIFQFTNTGKHNLYIKNVSASCGCTKPYWSEAAVPPGKKGSITIGFECSPVEHAFNKYLTVESNTNPAQTILEIKGKCVDKYKTIKEKYPMESGRLLFESNHAAFDKVYTNESNRQYFLKFYNNSDDTIFIHGFTTPKYIACQAFPNRVDPHQEGSVYVNYNGTKNDNLGFSFDRMSMQTNDVDIPNKPLFVSSELMEYFDTTSSGKASIYIKETNYEFGKVKIGDVKKHNFTIQNKGTDTLIIRKIRPSCGCTVVKMNSYTIAPNQSAQLSVEYNTLGATPGVNNKPITIISTDRKNPVVNIGVSVVVE